MKHQLEFIDFSENGNVLVGSSQLVNSCNWTGDLWYFVKEGDVASDNDVVSSGNNKYLHYPLPMSVSAGIFVNAGTKLLVGNDVGLLAIYSARENDDYFVDDHASTAIPSINNDVCFTAHDRSILSLSVSNKSSNNPKAVTGSMDNSIQVWDVESFTREINYDSAHSHYVTCVRFQSCNSETDDSGAAFVSAGLDGRCLLWDKRQKHPAQVLHEEDARFKHVEWFDDSAVSLFLGCESGKIRLIDTRNSKEAVFVHDLPYGSCINTMRCYSHDSKKYLAVCGDCRTLEVYHYGRMLRKIYSNESHVDYVRDTVWIKSQGKLLSCSWDSKIIKHHPFLNIDSEKNINLSENTNSNLEKNAISSETTDSGKEAFER